MVAVGCGQPLPSTKSQPAAAAVESEDVATRSVLTSETVISTVAVGSCLDQTKPHPILTDIRTSKPDLFLMIGDNVYADAMSARDLTRAYGALGQSTRFQELARDVPILAGWDDHDYGRNDSGAEFELKGESKRLMLDFFGEPPDSERRARAGNYDAKIVGPPGRRVQFVVLDTRWFRDPLSPAPAGAGRYSPHDEPGSTMLGEAQWTWLQEQLRAPAELRVLITGVQLLVTEHAYESWGLFPAERERMLALIASSGAQGVVVLSGDRHRSELSCGFDARIGYPLLELTASSLNRANHQTEDNPLRLPGTPLVGDENFGVLQIDWEAGQLRLGVRGLGGGEVFSRSVGLEQLRASSGNPGDLGCAPI